MIDLLLEYEQVINFIGIFALVVTALIFSKYGHKTRTQYITMLAGSFLWVLMLISIVINTLAKGID